MSTHLTWDMVNEISAGDPILGGLIKRRLAANYGEFLEILYDDITEGADEIRRQKHFIEKESEDGTTGRLQLFLKGRGYQCDFTAAGGNVDIEVKWKTFRWIGEAKKYTQVDKVYEGYLQLSTRYSPGTDPSGMAHGGLITYLRHPNAKEKMAVWKEALKDSFKDPSHCSFEDCNRFGPLGFYSEHEHGSHGTPFRVWHICLALHYDPLDKSGLATKARRAAKAKKSIKP